MVNSGAQVNEALYAMEPIHCTETDYKNVVRNAIQDFIQRCADRGEDQRKEFAEKQLKSLDHKFKIGA